MSVTPNKTLLLAAILVGVSSTSALADHGQLPGEQIKKLLGGAKGEGYTDNGKSFEVQYGEDGSLKLRMGGFTDTGKWTVEGDRYCGQWKKARKGKKGCWNVRHLRGGEYLFEGIDDTNDMKSKITK